ncbi:hypothetical protein P22_0382 [Propionispora sp. 2/2-37]|uniref:DeoR/GlpR family DNA-binding transcription regulator n=1 Tax=Propionispora sp. 2/2-37 TaxID=1677858 RepID=UPI0006BB73DE|nr:DeoR/GlpR family DNA-binding transcription regulator [Propionispora sp. 2/2-37]CUH94316.1 hypothetical protein P22_0382 [Propionispora sp. 2/2-37]
MFAEERKAAIVQRIQSGRPVKVGELSKQFSVSESTIRRDLQELEDSGLIQRTHGGAISTRAGLELSFTEKEIRSLDAKRDIAQAAAAMVQDGEALLLDSGTTTLQIAKALRGRPVVVATNSMDIAQVFTDDPVVEVWVLGGTYRKTTHSLVGFITNTSLQNLHFDKVFLGANGVSTETGVTTPFLTEAETKRHLLKAGTEVVLVVDSTKIGIKGLCRICQLEEVDVLLTDHGADPEELAAIGEQVRTMVVPTGKEK